MGSCTDVAWSPNGHFCVTSSCYTKETKQDVGFYCKKEKLMSSTRMDSTCGMWPARAWRRSDCRSS